VVRKQARDEAQRSIEFEYSFSSGVMPEAWLAGVGVLLLARMAYVIYRTKYATPATSGGSQASSP
jgi:hypothetical protein